MTLKFYYKSLLVTALIVGLAYFTPEVLAQGLSKAFLSDPRTFGAEKVLSDFAQGNQIQSKEPLSVRLSTRQTGRLTFQFEKFTDPQIPITLIDTTGRSSNYFEKVFLARGSVQTSSSALPATAAIWKDSTGDYALTLGFFGSAKTNLKPQHYQINTLLSSTGAVKAGQLQRVSDSSFKGSICSDGLAANLSQLAFSPPSRPAASSGGFAAAGVNQVVDLSLHVDSSYASEFGTSTAALQAMLNEVEAIYESQLNLVFNIKRIMVDQTLTFSSAETTAMLEDFNDYLHSKNLLNSSGGDVFHLFTNRNLLAPGTSDDGPAGVAFQRGVSPPGDPGVVCRFSSELSLGISERLADTSMSVVRLITAHEIGHNFSAEHTPSGIMAAVISSPLPTSFSSTSVTAITGFVDEYGSCLALESTDPDPTPTPTPTATPDGSPTPTPSSTATPTATPTSTPPGSGGFDGTGGETIGITLVSNLDTAGNFTAQVSLSEAVTNCTISLRGSLKADRISYGKLLVSQVVTGTSVTFSSSLAVRALKKNSKGQKQSAYVAAFLSCDAAAGASSPVQIKPERIRVPGQKVSMKRWLNLLSQSSFL